jgi:hypothetical protein
MANSQARAQLEMIEVECPNCDYTLNAPAYPGSEQWTRDMIRVVLRSKCPHHEGNPESWVARVEAKHGLPLQRIPGKVYVLHYEVPQIVKSVSLDYAGAWPATDSGGFLSERPIRHYTGWTQQAKPSKRISRHGPAALREVVYLQPGTVKDEANMKLTGTCPKCGEPLSDSLAGHG